MFSRTFSSNTKENKDSDVTTTSNKENKNTSITTNNKSNKLSVGGGGGGEVGGGGCWLFYGYSDLLLPLKGNGLLTCASKNCGGSPEYD